MSQNCPVQWHISIVLNVVGVLLMVETQSAVCVDIMYQSQPWESGENELAVSAFCGVNLTETVPAGTLRLKLEFSEDVESVKVRIIT